MLCNFPHIIFSVPLFSVTTHFLIFLLYWQFTLLCSLLILLSFLYHLICLCLSVIFTLPLGFSHHLSEVYLNRNITLLWCCSDIYLCHVMVILPVTSRHSTCLHCAFGLVWVKDPFPSDDKTYRSCLSLFFTCSLFHHITYSISHISNFSCIIIIKMLRGKERCSYVTTTCQL